MGRGGGRVAGRAGRGALRAMAMFGDSLVVATGEWKGGWVCNTVI